MIALGIAATSLRRALRDRATLFFTMALPVVIILVIGLATQGFADRAYPVGVVAPAPGELGRDLLREVEERLDVRYERFEDAASLRRAVRRGVVSAGLVIPSGYSERLRAGRPVEVAFVADRTRNFPAPVRAALAAAVAEQAGPLQAAALAAAESGRPFEQALAAASGVRDQVPPVAVQSEDAGPSGSREISFGTGFGYQAPANLVLFVFLTSIAGSAALIESRRLGVTRRMLAAPVGVRTVVAGETLGRLTIAGGQAVFIFAAGTLVFGVDWGDPLGAAALIFVFVLVGTAVGVLFGTVFRTPEQAGAVGPPVALALGMLGGCMWPLAIVPDWMADAGHAFPHAWAMDAWIDLTAFDRGLGGIATELVVLGGFAAVLLPVAVWRLRRAVLRG